jgi:pyruvate-formate lyase
MNSRIEKLRDALHVDKYPLSVEKARLWTKSFRESEGEPMVMRRAKALVNILENITIFIQDGELIVGNTASKPMGLEVVFRAGTWPQEEIDGLKTSFSLFLIGTAELRLSASTGRERLLLIGPNRCLTRSGSGLSWNLL